jgi:predicted DsbA family dithiol-disulfide isomerase
MEAPMPRIAIDVWSDYVCPFCYLQAPMFDRLRREYGEAVEIRWRAFELRPEPVPTLDPAGEYLRTVWDQSVYPMARQRGMTLTLPPVQPRSRKAFELAEFARDKRCFEQAHRALFKAFFEDGRNLSDINVLLDIGGSAGLNVNELRTALDQNAFVQRVLDDERLAGKLGISAVPTALIRENGVPLEKAYAIRGAQRYEALKASVERHIGRESAARIP